MTNKELAVQLYTALLQARVSASMEAHKSIVLPSADAAVQDIAELAEKLSHIDDQ